MPGGGEARKGSSISFPRSSRETGVREIRREDCWEDRRLRKGSGRNAKKRILQGYSYKAARRIYWKLSFPEVELGEMALYAQLYKAIILFL